MLMKIKRGQNIIFYVSLLRIISLIHMKRVSGVKASPSNIQKAKKIKQAYQFLDSIWGSGIDKHFSSCRK